MGYPDFLTAGLNPERLLPVEPMEFSIEGASEKKESKKFKDGKIVTAGSAVSSEKYTMKIGIQAVNWLSMQFAFGELAGVTSSIALPELRYGTVPSAAPYEVADADISDTNVWATVLTAGGWGRARPLNKAASAPQTGEFQVNTSSKKLVFNAAQAGAPFAYRIFKTYANIESIGAEGVFTALSSFAFSAVGYLDEEKVKIIIPKIIRANIPTLNISDVTKFDLEFDMIVSGSFRSAFQVYNLSTVGAT
jgi:enhancing lycopene biosynthesis protein 2